MVHFCVYIFICEVNEIKNLFLDTLPSSYCIWAFRYVFQGFTSLFLHACSDDLRVYGCESSIQAQTQQARGLATSLSPN